MTREWQQKRCAEFVMPAPVYYQAIWAVRDLSRMENRIAELDREIRSGATGASLVSDGKSNYGMVRPTENKAVEKIMLEGRVKAIRSALQIVPPSYQGIVLDNIVHHTKMTGYASKIWKIWKQRFLFHVAKNLSLM